MSSLDEDDRQLLLESARRFARHYRASNGDKLTRAGRLEEHWQQFSDLGWLGLAFGEALGGLDGSLEDVQVLMRAFGEGLVREPFAEIALLAGKTLEYCLPAAQSKNYLAALIEGASRPVLAHGEWTHQWGFKDLSCEAQAGGDGFTLAGTKRVVRDLPAADWILITANLDGAPALFRVPNESLPGRTITYRTIEGREAADLDLGDLALPGECLLAAGPQVAEGVNLAIQYTVACWLAELHGIAETLTRMTAEYLQSREQFGVKIGTFQALQHQFADMVITEEELRSLAWAAANTFDPDNAQASERTLRAAKARAGSISRKLAETAIQLHGGIGITDEFVVGHYLHRVVSLDAAFGDSHQQMLWLARNPSCIDLAMD